MLTIVAIFYALYKCSAEVHEVKTSSSIWCCGEMVGPLWDGGLVWCFELIWGILSRRSVWKKSSFFLFIFSLYICIDIKWRAFLYNYILYDILLFFFWFSVKWMGLFCHKALPWYIVLPLAQCSWVKLVIY